MYLHKFEFLFSHPNALVRATTARLMCKMVELYGPAKILSLTKERKEAILTTAVRFLMDGNLQTRYRVFLFVALSLAKFVFNNVI